MWSQLSSGRPKLRYSEEYVWNLDIDHHRLEKYVRGKALVPEVHCFVVQLYIRGNRRWFLCSQFHHYWINFLVFKPRSSARPHLENNTSHRPDIYFWGVSPWLLRSQWLGRNPPYCALHCSVSSIFALSMLGYTKVGDFAYAWFFHQDIVSFDILRIWACVKLRNHKTNVATHPMNNFPRVQIFQSYWVKMLVSKSTFLFPCRTF